MIVTRVFPSFTPDAGRTAVIVGVVGRVVPNAKQFGRERTVGVAVLLFKVMRISTGVEGEVTSGKPGVRTLMTSLETLVTVASRVTPPTVKATRVLAASLPVQPEVAQKRPPWSASAVPPVDGPKLGSQKETKGPAPAAVGWKAIEMVAAALSAPTVAVARTTAVPGNSEQSAVSAEPFCVTTEISGRLFWANTPKSVEKATPVPSGTFAPLRVTTAWMSVH